MHDLIKSMHKCLREAISNGGVLFTIDKFCFFTASCLFTVLNDCLFFLYFAISSSFHFYHLNTYLITNNNRKKN